MENCIRTRRSVRKFSDQPIAKETLEEIVDLARFSPSWKNSQVVRYHVVTNKELKEAIAENCVCGFTFNAKTISRCTALVVMTVVKGICGFEEDGSPTTTKGAGWEMFDAGIACQTFCLAAHGKGVGSVVLGIFDDAKVKETLSLPGGESVAALMAIGYPADAPKGCPPRKSVEELLSFID